MCSSQRPLEGADSGIYPSKKWQRHDLTCPPSCPHFAGLFDVQEPHDPSHDTLECDDCAARGEHAEAWT